MANDSGYDYLVLATGSRILPEAIEHFTTETRHIYTAEAALELRQALAAFIDGRIVTGIAGMPYVARRLHCKSRS